jgi:hypothetical protein
MTASPRFGSLVLGFKGSRRDLHVKGADKQAFQSKILKKERLGLESGRILSEVEAS